MTGGKIASTDPWRLRCPNGDTGFQVRQSHQDAESPIYCNTCRRRGDDPHHDHLIDVQDDSKVYP